MSADGRHTCAGPGLCDCRGCRSLGSLAEASIARGYSGRAVPLASLSALGRLEDTKRYGLVIRPLRLKEVSRLQDLDLHSLRNVRTYNSTGDGSNPKDFPGPGTVKGHECFSKFPVTEGDANWRKCEERCRVLGMCVLSCFADADIRGNCYLNVQCASCEDVPDLGGLETTTSTGM